MHRFLFAPEHLMDNGVWLDEEESHHLLRVVRLSVGDSVVAFDGHGHEYTGQVVEVTKRAVRLGNLRATKEARESAIKIWLLQGVAKGEKMDWIVQKATELGVSRITPIITERTIVKLDGTKGLERQDRWQKIAREASKQSRRTVVPFVEFPKAWRSVLEQWPQEVPLLIPWEESKGVGLRVALNRLPKPAMTVGLAIGPEGGFSQQEVAAAEELGGIPVSLGPRILRTETAGISTIAAIMYELGDWG